MDRKRIAALRRRLGLSQERFAQRLNVSLQTVRRWEAGATRPLPVISVRLEDLQREAGASEVRPGESGTRTARTGGRPADLMSLGGIFKGLGSLVDLVSRMDEEQKEEYSSGGEFEGPGGTAKGIYGFSVRLGLGGTPVVEQFGNVRDSEDGPVVADTREPITDVFDEGDDVLVIVELPGVREEDIRVTADGDTFEIAAATGARKYRQKARLPAQVDPDSLTSSYRNGILEVRIAKKPLAQ